MAFCPHCGKSVAEQAVKCLSCGGELEAKAKAARFKGTMIMQPAAAPAAPKPAAPAPEPAPAPVASTPAPAMAAEPSKAGPSKVAKHTMIGTGGAGLGPAMLAGLQKAQAAAMPAAPPPPAGSASIPPDPGPRMTDPALADTARDAAKSSTPAPGVTQAQAHDPAQDDTPLPRMLAGDPMADKPPAKAERRPALRSDGTPRMLQGSSAKPVIVIGIVGVILIAVAGYVAARVMGLL